MNNIGGKGSAAIEGRKRKTTASGTHRREGTIKQ